MMELAMRILAIVTLLWAGLGLLSCGNKGPLYLPEPEVAWTDFQPRLTLLNARAE